MSLQEETKERIQSKNINSFFDCLTDILMKYSNNSLDTDINFEKYFSKYMLCRYLSMSSRFIDIAEYLNYIQYNLTNKQLYHLAYNLIPKQKSGFIKYLKGKKHKIENIEEKEDNIKTSLKLFDI